MRAGIIVNMVLLHTDTIYLVYLKKGCLQSRRVGTLADWKRLPPEESSPQQVL